MGNDGWKISKAEKAMIDLLVSEPTESIIAKVLSSTKSTPSETLELFLKLRTEVGLKINDIVRVVREKAPDFVVGQTWIAKHDYANNFRKGQEVTVTHITKNGAVLNDVVEFDREQILQNFTKKLSKK